jgi:hypothetical protein
MFSIFWLLGSGSVSKGWMDEGLGIGGDGDIKPLGAGRLLAFGPQIPEVRLLTYFYQNKLVLYETPEHPLGD